jgi:hypothetical protein
VMWYHAVAIEGDVETPVPGSFVICSGPGSCLASTSRACGCPRRWRSGRGTPSAIYERCARACGLRFAPAMIGIRHRREV